MNTFNSFLKLLNQHKNMPGGKEYFYEQHLLYGSVTRKYAAFAALFFGYFEYGRVSLDLILLWVVPLLLTEVICIVLSYLYLSSKRLSVLYTMLFFQFVAFLCWLGYLYILSWYGATELEVVWRAMIVYIVLLFYMPAFHYWMTLLIPASTLVCGGIFYYIFAFAHFSLHDTIGYAFVVIFGWFLTLRFGWLGYRLAYDSYDVLNRNRQLVSQLDDMLIHDELTNAHNRRYFNTELSRYFDLYQRYKYPFCIAIMDIDHFKKINDTYGHHMGDMALIKLCESVTKQLRATDIFARYGGEEFVLILPEQTLDVAEKLLNKLRENIAAKVFDFDGVELQMTVSIGVTAVNVHDTHDSLIKRVDKALYRAKTKGRNRVIIG